MAEKQNVVNAALVDAGFETTNDEGEHGYVDWERYPGGWGSDGNARTERVTLVEGKSFYSTVTHIEPDGEYTFEESSPDFQTVQPALDWLDTAKPALVLFT